MKSSMGYDDEAPPPKAGPDDIWSSLNEIMDRHYANVYIHGGGEEACEAEMKAACDAFSARLAVAEGRA